MLKRIARISVAKRKESTKKITIHRLSSLFLKLNSWFWWSDMRVHINIVESTNPMAQNKKYIIFVRWLNSSTLPMLMLFNMSILAADSKLPISKLSIPSADYMKIVLVEFPLVVILIVLDPVQCDGCWNHIIGETKGICEGKRVRGDFLAEFGRFLCHIFPHFNRH